jgi:hypothetical protein
MSDPLPGKHGKLIEERGEMENKVIVLNKDGAWVELTNCFLVGAEERPEKVIYYKFLFSNGAKTTRDEMIKRTEQFLAEVNGLK